MLTTHGLFLTCTQKFPLYIYTHIIKYLDTTPCVKDEKRTLFTWKDGLLLMVVNPICSGSLPGINCPPLTFQSHLTPSHPFGPYYVTMKTSTISVFLVRNVQGLGGVITVKANISYIIVASHCTLLGSLTGFYFNVLYLPKIQDSAKLLDWAAILYLV